MSLLKRRQVLAAFGALPLVVAGCGGGGGGSSSAVAFAAKAMVDNITDAVILQTYTNLNSVAGELLAAVQALQATPNDAALDAAQAAWKAARVPWESGEGFLFGPVDALGIDPAIDTWPLNTPDLQAFLVANPDPTQADIHSASDDLRGFHAIEFLLFGDGTLDNDKAAAELTAAETNYLVALAQEFRSRTQELVDAWDTDFNARGPYATQLKSPGAGATYSGYSAVVEELVGALVGIADEVGNAKIAEPFGTSAATADTSLVESQYSWNSLTDFHHNLQSIVNIYTGKLGFSWQTDTVTSAMNGLYAFVAAHDQTLADRVLDEAVAAQQAIALVKGDGDNATTAITGTAQPFRNQIRTDAGRALVQDAIDACATLQATLASDVQPLVGATEFA